jgi:hypothetical protein
MYTNMSEKENFPHIVSQNLVNELIVFITVS